MKRKYVINVSEAEKYAPPRHKNTLNYRLAGKGGLAAENMDVVLGELKRGSEAQYHVHRVSEQSIFILDGECTLDFEDGRKERAGKDDLILIPKGLGHRLVVTSEDFRALVIYSPKLGENDMIPIDH